MLCLLEIPWDALLGAGAAGCQHQAGVQVSMFCFLLFHLFAFQIIFQNNRQGLSPWATSKFAKDVFTCLKSLHQVNILLSKDIYNLLTRQTLSMVISSLLTSSGQARMVSSSVSTLGFHSALRKKIFTRYKVQVEYCYYLFY